MVGVEIVHVGLETRVRWAFPGAVCEVPERAEGGHATAGHAAEGSCCCSDPGGLLEDGLAVEVILVVVVEADFFKVAVEVV